MEFTCVICGASFTRRRGGPYPETCGSTECSRKRRAQASVEHRWRQRGGSTVQTRTCGHCGNSFEFVRTKGMRGRGPGFCSEDCRRESLRLAQNKASRDYHARHRDRLAAKWRADRRRVTLAAYGLTPEQYDAMLKAQDGRCAICRTTDPGRPSGWFEVDHDHSCCPGITSCGKCVRGLLCQSCNGGMGLFKDDPAILTRAAEYLSAVRV